MTEAEETLQIRMQLYAALGGKCAMCASTQQLEVNHIRGKDYDANKLNSLARVRRYLDEYIAGVPMNLLCKPCNGGFLNVPRALHRITPSPLFLPKCPRKKAS